MKKFLIPLVLFFGLIVFLAIGLNRDPREIPSPLINKPAPEFTLPQLSGETSFSPAQMKGQVWMLNVWATWCVACREEHPVMVAFAKKYNVPIVGLSYKEIQPQDPMYTQPLELRLDEARMRSQKWLNQHGNPYITTVMDLDGRVGIEYGVYGVPETYVIDREGVIRYKQIGALTPDALINKLMPLIEKLKQS
jgi:cytochrome c biogenesis protein CcmG, thiol:disulfide interchange protein DsbE